MKPKLYNTQRCPYVRRTRIVLREKGMDFEVHEVDLRNKSEEFLEVSPTGKVPRRRRGLPLRVERREPVPRRGGRRAEADAEEAKRRAYARIWMSFADAEFFPAVFVASVGRDRGFSEERVSEAFEKLKTALQELEESLQSRPYLADEALADVAHAGIFVRLRELEERGEVSLDECPDVAAWMERLESRENYKAAA